MTRDPLRNAYESKLATYESAGLTELADRQRKAIAKLEKAVKADAKATEDAVAETPVAKYAAKKTAKKAAKKATK